MATGCVLDRSSTQKRHVAKTNVGGSFRPDPWPASHMEIDVRRLAVVVASPSLASALVPSPSAPNIKSVERHSRADDSLDIARQERRFSRPARVSLVRLNLYTHEVRLLAGLVFQSPCGAGNLVSMRIAHWPEGGTGGWGSLAQRQSRL